MAEAPLTFHGEEFALPERTGAMAMYEFAHLAEEGASEMEEKAAIYALLESCIAEEDWARFRKVAKKHRATEDELIQVIGQVLVVLAGRPTSRSSDSSDGPVRVDQSSMSTPAERAIGRLSGRPDLQNVIDMGRQTQAS